MFIISLKFTDNKANAGQFMQGHNEWLEQHFNEGVFLLSGSLQPNIGGGILAHSCTLAEITDIVNQDPFVKNGIVDAEIVTLAPSKAAPQMEFLLPIEV